MKISIIGAGAMGGAMVEGLMESGVVERADICVSDPSQRAVERFAESGVSLTTDNQLAAEQADVVCIVVKPWLVEGVIGEIRSVLRPSHQMLIVVAAGIKAQQVSEWLADKSLPFFLVIPNIAIAVRQSVSFIVPCGASKEQVETIRHLFDQLGQSVITEERLLAAGTTLASCGIAYALRYVRAATEGGIEMGFRSGEAERIVAQTVKGAVELLQHSDAHPEALIDQVCTPGGVTIRGLNEMEHAGFSSAVVRGLKAGL